MSDDIVERYTKIQNLGEGSYGVVFKAVDTETDQLVAIKKIKINIGDEGLSTSSLREVSLLSSMQNENIVKLLRTETYQNNLYLIFEYCDNDLNKYIKSQKEDISIYTIKSILQQLLRALVYCHSQRIFHRDIKPGNILINNDGTIKLGDFGLSRSFGSTNRGFTPEVVTLWYRAPEVLLGASYSTAVDMWSVGVIFGELIQRKPMFCGNSERDQFIKICSVLGTPSESSWPGINKLCRYYQDINEQGIDLYERYKRVGEEGVNLLYRLLTFNPEKRISATDALSHKFISC